MKDAHTHKEMEAQGFSFEYKFHLKIRSFSSFRIQYVKEKCEIAKGCHFD